MQRPPFACRRAAHSLNARPSDHIWISEELLSRALYQFFPPACAHQKRHGSHVPGPLEARRRAVKRRMTAQAHMPQSGPPPSLFNFSALFGGRPTSQPLLRYEPPSISRTPKPLETPLAPPWPFDVDTPAPPNAYPEKQTSPQGLTPTIATSMLGGDKNTHTSPVLDILDAKIRGIEAQALELLKHRLIDDSDKRSLYRAKFEQLLLAPHSATKHFMEDIYSLEALLPNREMVSIISPILAEPGSAVCGLASFIEENIHNKDIIGKVFDTLPRSLLRTWLKREIAKALGYPKLVGSRDVDERLDICLMFIRRVDFEMTEDIDGMRLSELAYERFASSGILFEPKGDATTSGLEMMVRMLLHRIPHDDSTKGIPPEKVRDFIRGYKLPPKVPEFDLVMSDLLLRMRKKDVPNHGVAQAIVTYIYAKRGLEGVLRFLNHIKKTKRKVLSGTAFLDQFMLGIIQHRSSAPYTSDTIRLARSIVALKHEKTEPSDKILNAYMSRLRFRHLLDRARDARVLPQLYQTMPMEEMWNQRVEAIHQLAYQYSIDNARSHNQNVRSIVYLYRYLTSNNLPIGPLFTQALVRICLTQPLLQNKFVSARRLIWVCNIVAQVEGVDVSTRIENIFWHWRGDLIKHAKRKLDALAGPSPNKAHVNTLKRLGMI